MLSIQYISCIPYVYTIHNESSDGFHKHVLVLFWFMSCGGWGEGKGGDEGWSGGWEGGWCMGGTQDIVKE